LFLFLDCADDLRRFGQALALNVTALPSFTVRLLIAASTGALFASLTVTLNDFASLNAGEPLSVARTVIV